MKGYNKFLTSHSSPGWPRWLLPHLLRLQNVKEKKLRVLFNMQPLFVQRRREREVNWTSDYQEIVMKTSHLAEQQRIYYCHNNAVKKRQWSLSMSLVFLKIFWLYLTRLYVYLKVANIVHLRYSHHAMLAYQIIILYTLNLHNVVCQSYLNKAGKIKKPWCLWCTCYTYCGSI